VTHRECDLEKSSDFACHRRRGQTLFLWRFEGKVCERDFVVKALEKRERKEETEGWQRRE